MQGLFFTGTDTGVGKTYVTAAVAQQLRRQGHTVRVCKPVATGATLQREKWYAEDTLALAEAAEDNDLDAVTPWTLREPAAPPVAARLEGVVLRRSDLVAAVRRRAVSGSVLLVEGVGGLLCPLTDEATVADLAMDLDLPIVIVARRGMGTLNHTLLTLEAARARDLSVAGVVVSETHPMEGIAEEANVGELRRLGVPVLAVMPYGAPPAALDTVNWMQLVARSMASCGA